MLTNIYFFYSLLLLHPYLFSELCLCGGRKGKYRKGRTNYRQKGKKKKKKKKKKKVESSQSSFQNHLGPINTDGSEESPLGNQSNPATVTAPGYGRLIGRAKRKEKKKTKNKKKQEKKTKNKKKRSYLIADWPICSLKYESGKTNI